MKLKNNVSEKLPTSKLQRFLGMLYNHTRVKHFFWFKKVGLVAYRADKADENGYKKDDLIKFFNWRLKFWRVKKAPIELGKKNKK